MKSIIKNALILMTITLTAGVSLGAVHAITEEPIAAQEKKKKRMPARRFFRKRKPLRPGKNSMKKKQRNF